MGSDGMAGVSATSILDRTREVDDYDDDNDDEVPDLISLEDNNQGQLPSTSSLHLPHPSSASIDVTSPSIPSDHGMSTALPSASASSSALLPPCPVTILSGFLGSGKTTLVQYILQSPDHGKRIAVIENEFGEGLAIESMIARDGLDPSSTSLQDLIELPNGCICCTVKDSLVATLELLLDRRRDLDYILIEASGMANPGPIASVFWLDGALESRLKLDGIVTVVDGVNILEQLESTEEAAQQIAYADRIVLNKVDLLEGVGTDRSEGEVSQATTRVLDKLSKVEQKLRTIHPTAPILRTSYSKVPDLGWILNADCFGGDSRLEELETIWNKSPDAGHDPLDHDHSHHHDHHGDDKVCADCYNLPPTQHRHTDSITMIALRHAGSVDLTRLNSWLADILWPHQDESDAVLTAMLHQSIPSPRHRHRGDTQKIFRIKGIVSATYQDEEDVGKLDELGNELSFREAYRENNTGLDRRRFIVQAVHDLWEVCPASDDLMFKQDEDREGKVVIIGRFLKEMDLRHGFNACFLGS